MAEVVTTRKRWTAALGAGVAAVGAVSAYSVFVEPLWLELTRPRIHVRDLPAALEGFRIALLTDMHAGAGTPLWLIRRACRMAMREQPDLIALTGDFVADDAPDFGDAIGALSELDAPYGVYAVPGNHDFTVGIGRWHRQIGAHPTIQDLTNRARTLDVDGARLCVAGVDDLAEGTPTLDRLPPPDERDFTLLLAHEPSQAERARRGFDQVDLIVSGHTHGGQVRLPWVGALAGSDPLYDEGLRRRPWTQVYTSRGVGTVHLPIRFLCRPEVAVLQLTGSARPSLGE